MQYMFLVYTNEKAFQTMASTQREQAMGAYIAYTESLRKAGVLKSSDRLRPTADGTTVRVENGKSQVLDGPYADTKEQLGRSLELRLGGLRGLATALEVDQLAARGREQPRLGIARHAAHGPIC